VSGGQNLKEERPASIGLITGAVGIHLCTAGQREYPGLLSTTLSAVQLMRGMPGVRLIR
jgi:hypothetical protein